MQYDEFKLDGAAILDSDSPHQRIVLYNFNVPADRSQDPAAFEAIRRLVETDFPPEDRGRVAVPLYFQLSAVYTLVHRETGEERLWQGSFNPRSRDLGRVTVFRPFEPETFVEYVLSRSSTENVLHQLQSRVQGKDSVWSVDRLLSIIVSVQATVRTTHRVFVNHPELLGANGGANRDNGGEDQEPPAQRPRAGANPSSPARARRRTVFRLHLE